MSFTMHLFHLFILSMAQLNLSCADGEKNNILLIILDDMRPLGENDLKLPNIQNLTERSVSFKKAYAQQALCAPSRNSFLTGRRPDTLRLYDAYSYWRTAVGNFTTMPQFFKDNGYNTYSVGKVFHNGASSNHEDDYPYSWSEPVYHPPSNKYKDAPVCKEPKSKILKKNLICPVNVKDQPGETLPDLETLEYAKEILKERSAKKKPFFLAVGFHKPHIPLKFPSHYLDQVPMDIIRPPSYPSMTDQQPLVAYHPWMDVRMRDDITSLDIKFPMGVMPTDWAMKIRQSYLAAMLYMDDLVGQLLKHVNMRKTIVVLLSDHGWSLGENGLWAKYSNYDVALKVPLLIHIPRMKKRAIDTPVELIDLFPTLADITGLSKDIPNCKNVDNSTLLCFEGKSLVPLMRPKKLEKLTKVTKKTEIPYAISQYPRPGVYPTVNSDQPRLRSINIMGYSIRLTRYRYTEWIAFDNKQFKRNWKKVYGAELYDHYLDPEEAENMYLIKEYQYIVRKLSRMLRAKVGK